MMRILGATSPVKRGSFCQLALVAAAVAALISADAQAYSYGSWGSSGSYGSYAAVSYSSGGSYGSGGSYASSGSHGGGLRARMAARREARAARRAARSSHGSYGSTGSYGSAGGYASHGSAGSYGTVAYAAPVVSYGSAGGYGSAGSVSYGSAGSTSYSAPVEYSTPVDAGCDCVSSVSHDASMLADGSASIEVTLPADAKVYVNNSLTKSSGTSRSYVSNGLSEGQTYAYKLRVEFEKDGKQVVKNETLKLKAGNKVALDFNQTKTELQLGSAAGPAKTELKVSVPEDARVLLAGSPTKQTGAERTFTTNQLKAGQNWEGYVVRVELERDGKQLVQERTLKVEGGETYELAFDFDATEPLQVAQLD